MENLLEPSNPDLKHVRVLRLSRTLYYTEERHGSFLKRLLLSMPTDALREIYISSPNGMSPEIQLIILRTQRNVKNHASLVSSPQCGLHSAPTPDKLGRITSLSLQLEMARDVRGWAGILAKVPQIEVLALDIIDGYRVSTTDVIRALFDPPRSGVEIKLALKRLYLRRFNFNHCTRNFVNFLNSLVASLEHLTFVDCFDTWIVQQELTGKPFKLCSFTDADFYDTSGRLLPPIDGFLRGIERLNRFSNKLVPAFPVERWNIKGVGWQTLQQHANHLEIIEVDDVTRADRCAPGSHRSMMHFRNLCSHLVKLKQLAIRPPATSKVSRDLLDGFSDFLHCLKHLTSLTSLKL